MSVYHDEIEIEDFEYDEQEETYYYPCPCGDRFQITKEELAAGEEVATCPSCSLIVKVIYDIVKPPPVYPLLETTPAPLQPNVAYVKSLRYKLDFLHHYSKLKMDLGDKDATSGYKRKVSGEAAKQKQPLEYRWDLFPAELRPNAPKRAKAPKDGPSTSKKPANIDDLLAALEKAETQRTVIKTEKVDTEENKNIEEQDEEAFDDSDQEMDEGTDYNQNYFDNGDDYLDEEGDDDGPIY